MGLEQDWAEATPLTGGQATPMNTTGVPSLQQQFDQAAPPPSMGDVAINAIAKGVANLLNTPETLKHLMALGLNQVPGSSALPGIKTSAENPTNTPMDAMTSMGLVDPAKNPQTPAQRIVDAAIQTAVGSAMIPTGGGAGGALKSAAVGATSGTAAQTTKELTGSDLLAIAVGMGTPFAISKLTESGKQILVSGTRKQTLQDAQTAGYVVEPSAVRSPSSKLEAVAGKASIAQEAAIRNQQVTNGLSAEAIGLPKDTQLSLGVVEAVRKSAGKAYDDVASLSPQAATALDELKQARSDATGFYRFYERSADPSALKEAKRLTAQAETLEQQIEQIAVASGKPKLPEQLKGARQLIARTYDVERALNLGSGNVSAPILGRMFDQGRPLSGELSLIGRFAQAFPRVAREIESVPPSGVSGTDAASSAVLAVGGAAASGSPAGMVAGGAPLLRGPARNKVLSPGYQQNLTVPPKPKTPTRTTAAQSAIAGTIQASEP